MLERRHAIVGACTLALLQALTLCLSRGQTSALLSDAVQLLLGILCVVESMRAWRRSIGAWRYHWLWLSVTFGIWTAAQVLGVYIDKTGQHFLDPVDDLLFFMSGIPFGMLLFLDPDEEREAFGDQVLQALARRMKCVLRSYDSAGRYGGEEFLIVLPNCDAQNTFAKVWRNSRSARARGWFR